MDPSIQRQIKRGVAGIANIQASCGQQSGNCISEYCHRIYLSLMNIWNCSGERSFSKAATHKKSSSIVHDTEAAKQP